ncbi:Uu.00g126290.m01.CDS01 [Anthostomella pinea]|uniref:Uu.00g126290.m01.CDS01 n=1 Tax=Anthostomella pinea TaxID=933095 RepID=A0AAI8YHN8_9PEZI|nr:Uu.00g126290.m01.CDS01 [Anthostomella pinea]
MARSLPPRTWKHGFVAPATESVPLWADDRYFTAEDGKKAHMKIRAEAAKPTSSATNNLGRSELRSWPHLYSGTQSPGDTHIWWKPETEVDVIICGGGPFGLAVAMNLARQGISFRIVDKSESPCLTGRADGLHPRALEYLESWGVSTEAAEEGPILNSTVVFRNGVKLFHGESSICDSRYKGIHILTQGQVERVYIRDLLRHQALVERCKTVDSFVVQDNGVSSHPVTATFKDLKNGETEVVRAKYLVGADGASSCIREKLQIPFDGLATDCFWVILDCQFKTDYPHILGFNIVISAEHGGCIIIPREQGHTRFYVQVTGERAAKMAEARDRIRRANGSTVGETQVHEHNITPEEALEHLNKIMTPWKVEFASAMSWFAVWRVNERVARSFSTADQRVHIGGDASHVHSVLGAFGLNSSIYDAANLSWKLTLSVKGVAKPDVLLPTYDAERRLFANRVIRASGAYLRFICNLNLPLAQLRGLGDDLETHDENLPTLDGTAGVDQHWLGSFFSRNAMFLLGVEGPIVQSAICPQVAMKSTFSTAPTASNPSSSLPTSVVNGGRAPSPRVCLDRNCTGYLYDRMKGVGKFHILIFVSDLKGSVRGRVARLVETGLGPSGFWSRYGGGELFNLVVIIKSLQHEVEESLDAPEFASLRDKATLVYDDRAPDDDAHYCYGINHARGAVVVVRPDLLVGMSAWPECPEAIADYFGGFLQEPKQK